MRTAPTIAGLLVGVLLVALLAIGGVAGGEAGAADAQQLESCAADSPANFTAPAGGDAIGYVDGYWYDQPIRIGNDTAGNDTDGGTNGSTADGNGTTTEGNGTATDSNRTTTDANRSDDGGQQATRTVDATDGGNDTASENGSATENSSTNGTGGETGATGGNGTASDASWRDGRPLDVTDGIDERERAAIVARTAARVETQRCLSFESVPEVRVTNRSAVRAANSEALANRSAALRQFDDARLAAGMLLGSEIDPATGRSAARGTATMGFYDPASDEIVLVAIDGETTIDEPTLAHELVHALQDQHFDLERFDAARTDAAMAESGLIEGDAALVQHHYAERCRRGDWSTSCLTADAGSSENSDYLAMELFFFQPYNGGARFVERHYETGGWDAVDARYADVPTSSKALLAPVSTEHVEPANVTFPTAVNDSWTQVTPEDGPDYDVLGPGTIGAAMLAPTFDGDVEAIYRGQRVSNIVDQSRLHPLYPYDYGVDAATGWTGGRLEVYRNDADATAVRWRTEWERPEDANTFRDRYVQLLDVRGDAESGTYVDTYEFSGDRRFEGHVSVRQEGTTVTVVHAPSVDALRALDDRAARETREGSSSSIGEIRPSRRPAQDEFSRGGTLGAIGAVIALVALSGWIVVRRRR